MNCGEVNAMLDLLMDGELTEEQRRDMDAHARECPECAAAIRSAEQLKALFAQMEPEVDVPLKAQAGWRGAVREESSRRRRGKLIRWVASAAAVVVALVGVGVSLNLRGATRDATTGVMLKAGEQAYTAEQVSREAAPNAAPAQAMSEDETAGFAAAGGAVVEADGAFDAEAFEAEEAEDSAEDSLVEMEEARFETVCAAAAQRAPACELRIHVTDVETACERVCDLAQEYDGTADVQALADGGANVYVDVDADDAGDLLSAVAMMDASGQAGELPGIAEEGRVLVLLTLLRQEE